MIIYLDFDGTVVEHNFPSIGKYNEGCYEVIDKLKKAGHKIFLNTYRADLQVKSLNESVDYLKLNGYDFKPLEKKMDPFIWDLEFSKENGILFLDDICEGIPLKESKFSPYPKVDWTEVDKQLDKYGLYEKI